MHTRHAELRCLVWLFIYSKIHATWRNMNGVLGRQSRPHNFDVCLSVNGVRPHAVGCI